MPMMDESRSVLVRLSREEAIVLFEWLVKQDGLLSFQDPAEQSVLWRIEGILESLL